MRILQVKDLKVNNISKGGKLGVLFLFPSKSLFIEMNGECYHNDTIISIFKDDYKNIYIYDQNRKLYFEGNEGAFLELTIEELISYKSILKILEDETFKLKDLLLKKEQITQSLTKDDYNEIKLLIEFLESQLLEQVIDYSLEVRNKDLFKKCFLKLKDLKS